MRIPPFLIFTTIKMDSVDSRPPLFVVFFRSLCYNILDYNS